jgi:anthranilate synthase component 2
MLLLLDNYDSFTYNLAQYAGELGVAPTVRRNDELDVAGALALEPAAIIISPGPCSPAEAGISVPLVRAAADRRIPLLGVCLGHQSIGEAFGGAVVRADRLMHGKTSEIVHDARGVFAGMPQPMTVMRYHSLVVRSADCPAELEIAAWTADRPAGTEIMGLRHRTLPIHGVQFHPESVGTPTGKRMLATFLELAGLLTAPSSATTV